MISRRSIALALTGLLLAGPAWSASASAVKMFDSDNDGTLDLAEVKKAAAALFAKLDPDHDGTLDLRELRGRLTAKELVAADPDHDGTLTLDEYLAVVEQRFNAADPDHDGALDAKELNSRGARFAAIVALKAAALDWERRRFARERTAHAQFAASLYQPFDSRLALCLTQP